MYPDDPVRDVLKKVENGEMSIEEGVLRLAELEKGLPAAGEPAGIVAPQPIVEPLPSPEWVEPDIPEAHEQEQDNFDFSMDDYRKLDRLRIWWLLPFILSLILTALGAWWIYSGWRVAEFGLGFWLAWLPFLLGVGGMALSWSMESGPWLHVRIRQRPGSSPQNIAISLPLPLRALGFFIRIFKHKIPGEVYEQGMDEILDALNQSTAEGQPFHIEVDEDDEHVQIWIGGKA
jgi:hypothetical protein